jgi:hypothetical protein
MGYLVGVYTYLGLADLCDVPCGTPSPNKWIFPLKLVILSNTRIYLLALGMSNTLSV